MPSADFSTATPAGSGPQGEASSGLKSAERAPPETAATLASSGTLIVTGALNVAPLGGAPTTRHASPLPSAPSASTAAAVMAGSGPAPDARRKLRRTPGGIEPDPPSSPGSCSSSATIVLTISSIPLRVDVPAATAPASPVVALVTAWKGEAGAAPALPSVTPSPAPTGGEVGNGAAVPVAFELAPPWAAAMATAPAAATAMKGRVAFVPLLLVGCGCAGVRRGDGCGADARSRGAGASTGGAGTGADTAAYPSYPARASGRGEGGEGRGRGSGAGAGAGGGGVGRGAGAGGGDEGGSTGGRSTDGAGAGAGGAGRLSSPPSRPKSTAPRPTGSTSSAPRASRREAASSAARASAAAALRAASASAALAAPAAPAAPASRSLAPPKLALPSSSPTVPKIGMMAVALVAFLSSLSP